MKVLQSSLWRGALVVLVGRLEHVVSQQQLRVGADRLHKDQPHLPRTNSDSLIRGADRLDKDQPHRRPLARAPLANLLPAQHSGVCGVQHAADAAAPALLSGLLLVLLESGEGGERVGGQELEPAQQLLPSTHRTSAPSVPHISPTRRQRSSSSRVSIAISSRCAAASSFAASKKAAPEPARPASRRREPALKSRAGQPTKLR